MQSLLRRRSYSFDDTTDAGALLQLEMTRVPCYNWAMALYKARPLSPHPSASTINGNTT